MPIDEDRDEPPPLELERHALDEATSKRSSASQHSSSDDNQHEHGGGDDEPSLMDEIVATAQRAREEKRRQQERERNSQSFGSGLRRGFFGATKPARTSAPTQTQQKPTTKTMPTREDLLIVKPPVQDPSASAPAQPSFVFPEVQSALASMRQLDPKAWMDAKFFEKLARSPSLARALQDPRFTQAIDELQRDPEAAIRKYRTDAAVSAMLQEFMGFLGNHFEELGKQQDTAAAQKQQQEQDQRRDDSDSAKQRALRIQPTSQPATSASAGIVDLDAARRDAVANMPRSPEEDAQVQKILQSPELLQALSDAELMQRLRACAESPQELRRLRTDPVLARKLQLLVDAQLVQFE